MIEITQQETLDIFKENPYFKFTPNDILNELRSKGIDRNIQSICNNIRRLHRADCIVNSNGRWYYQSDDEDDVIIETIIQEAQNINTGLTDKPTFWHRIRKLLK